MHDAIKIWIAKNQVHWFGTALTLALTRIQVVCDQMVLIWIPGKAFRTRILFPLPRIPRLTIQGAECPNACSCDALPALCLHFLSAGPRPWRSWTPKSREGGWPVEFEKPLLQLFFNRRCQPKWELHQVQLQEEEMLLPKVHSASCNGRRSTRLWKCARCLHVA